MSENISWSGKQDEILIGYVRNHESIYNIKNKDYRKAQLKQNLWREIGVILNKTDIECSKRWAYIRDYYIRRRGKAGIGTSGEAARKRSNLLSFLDNCSSTKRSTITNMPCVGVNTENIGNQETGAVDEEFHESSWQNINKDTCIKCEFVIEDRETENTTIKSVDNSHSSNKRKVSSISDERTNVLKKIDEKQENSTTEETDETDLFFASMGKIVKKLPQYERAQLRMKIGILVGNAELKYLANRENKNTRPIPQTTTSCGTDFSEDRSSTTSPSMFETTLNEHGDLISNT